MTGLEELRASAVEKVPCKGKAHTVRFLTIAEHAHADQVHRRTASNCLAARTPKNDDLLDSTEDHPITEARGTLVDHLSADLVGDPTRGACYRHTLIRVGDTIREPIPSDWRGLSPSNA